MTCPRQEREELEKILVGDFGVRAADSHGRRRAEEEDPVRTCFQRDADRILHSKAFRRLKNKTQVFLTPMGDHYRTRLSHTLEVSQNARTIARALDLNETLTEAIALGHDLGHTPFGHAGERVLNEMNPAGFKHNEQSVRVAQCLEKNGQGLNLTWEVLDGMKNHSMHSMPHTLEEKLCGWQTKLHISTMILTIPYGLRFYGKKIFQKNLRKSLEQHIGNGSIRWCLIL